MRPESSKEGSKETSVRLDSVIISDVAATVVTFVMLLF